MHCFIHTDKEAVGVCKSCGKAICLSCLKDVHPGLACSEACEKEIKEFNAVINKIKRYYGIGSSKKLLTGSTGFFLVAGLVNLAVITAIELHRGTIDLGLFGLAAIFFVAAGYAYFREKVD